MPDLDFANWTTSRIAWSIGLALGMLVGSAIIGGLTVIYLPPQYFCQSRSRWRDASPTFYWAVVIAKNLLGIVAIVLGIAMLVLPGQGLLTILIGLMLLSIPGKRQFAAAVIRRSQMLDSVNRWRAKFGRQALEVPGPG